jgi:hypothetical protein
MAASECLEPYYALVSLRGLETMKSQRANEGDAVTAVSQLIEQFGVEGLVALIADITEQKSDYLLLSGERQKAAQCMRYFRILQRAAQALGH